MTMGAGAMEWREFGEVGVVVTKEPITIEGQTLVLPCASSSATSATLSPFPQLHMAPPSSANAL